MTNSTSELQKLRVVIWPYQGQYAASCLETSIITVRDTPEEAAAGITRLIDGLVHFSLINIYSLEKILHEAPQEDVEKYNRGIRYQHTPSLSQEVQSVVRDIEYRIYPYYEPALTGREQLAALKAKQWNPEGREARIARALEALNAPGPTFNLDKQTWKWIAEEVLN